MHSARIQLRKEAMVWFEDEFKYWYVLSNFAYGQYLMYLPTVPIHKSKSGAAELEMDMISFKCGGYVSKQY